MSTTASTLWRALSTNCQLLCELLYMLEHRQFGRDPAKMLRAYRGLLNIGWWYSGPAELLPVPENYGSQFWLINCERLHLLDLLDLHLASAHLIPLQFCQVRSRRLWDCQVNMHIYDVGNKKEENSRNQHQWLPKQWKVAELVMDLKKVKIKIQQRIIIP